MQVVREAMLLIGFRCELNHHAFDAAACPRPAKPPPIAPTTRPVDLGLPAEGAELFLTYPRASAKIRALADCLAPQLWRSALLESALAQEKKPLR